MVSMEIIQAVIHLLVTSIGLPMYLRIIYILLKKSYRSNECYRIMIHIGIAQCLYSPGTVFYSLSNLLGYDLWNLSYITIKLCSSVVRMEAVMSLVLAMNRLKVMCDLRYPSVIHRVIVVFAWIVGILNFAFLFSPWYDYFIAQGHFLAQYDRSKSLTPLFTTLGVILIIGSSVLTLIVYAAIVIYMIKAQSGFRRQAQSGKEKKILIYAFVKFLFDALLTTGMYLPLPKAQVVDAVVGEGYVMNNLLIPPILYLLFNRDVRNDFMRSTASSVAPISYT
ncbi:hypothetical protein QR680_009981 [Steinernema hermaphroditum]|uniref:Uncharacterized protein n=1 Tax=Steinernema hermaphroditum TaxID=289476 RepID=A0AA39M9V1_9BILA|nr:hypothetical protein QR680_009981 [Steinernema hermaphroditum]